MRQNDTALPFLFTLLATATLLLTLPNQNLLAQCDTAGTTFAGGTGIEGNPFQISTIEHLNNIRDNSGGCNYLEKHFVLTKDLDFEDTDSSGTAYVYPDDDLGTAAVNEGWKPIGHDTNKDNNPFDGTQFKGTFDGDGHVIRSLMISRPDEDFIGLFGSVFSGASLKNLGVEGQNISGGNGVGGIAGANNGTIISCYSTGAVMGNHNVGGVVGQNISQITSCYATGSVTGGAGSTNVGGFVGQSAGQITSCYATGSVTSGTGSTKVGGLVGSIFPARVDTSYWDTETSGITTNNKGTGKTTAEMKELTLADLGDTMGLSWDVGTSDQYPALRTYKVNDSDVQVQGDVIAGQPCPRVECGPLVSIAAGTSPVTEGKAAEFTLTRTGSTAAELTVAIMVTGGDFLTDPLAGTEGASMTELVLVLESSDSVTVTIAAGQDSQTFTVDTDDDMLDEADGMITATIPISAATYRLVTATATVDIADDDLPLVSIEAGTSPVTEGTAAEFTLTRVGITTEALTVTVSVTDPDGFLSEAAPTEAVFGAGEATKALSLTTDDDDMDEADGSVTVTITADASNFRLGTDTATVDITDNDLPLVSIAAGTSPVTEGTAAEFTLTRVGITTEALTATVSVTDPGGFLSGAAPTEAVFVAGDATVTLSLTTDDDDMDEAEGMVTVTVTEAVASYRVDADNSSATVTITDNDDPPPGTPLSFLGTISDQTYTQNTAITALVLPEATGGTGPYTYTLTPVPAGLMFDDDPASRTLSGMPTETADPATTHTYMVTDTTPTTALTKILTFTITVNAEATLTFSGTVPNQTYTQNTAITDLVLPVATGGMEPYTYTLTPVPAGLMFDAPTRTLSGTPTETADPATTHTYMVTDGTTTTALTKTLTFTITVNAEGSPMFSDPVPNQIYTQNTAITDLVLPEAMGGMGALTYALTPVPAGLSFDAGTRTLLGTPTMAADPATTHTYTVTDSTPDTALTASLTFTITVNEAEEPTLGIGSQGAAVHVYPNPASDVLYIEFSSAGDYGIALLTLTGKSVLGGWHAGGGTKKLDVSTLKGGVYFLKIEDSEGGSHTVRIVR